MVACTYAARLLVLVAAAAGSEARATTHNCTMTTRGGQFHWTCPLNKFCSSVNSCGPFACGTVVDSAGAPRKATCPDGMACCASNPPGTLSETQATDTLHQCANLSRGETCCGSGVQESPCAKGEHCCLDNAHPWPVDRPNPPTSWNHGRWPALDNRAPRAKAATATSALKQGYQPQEGSWCVTTAASPVSPSEPNQYGPGECCLNTSGGLLYACPTGGCCGVDPQGINECIDPKTMQCCHGPAVGWDNCTACGWGCDKKQICHKTGLGQCDTAPACTAHLKALCPDRDIVECNRCLGRNWDALQKVCAEDDYDKYCSETLES